MTQALAHLAGFDTDDCIVMRIVRWSPAEDRNCDGSLLKISLRASQDLFHHIREEGTASFAVAECLAPQHGTQCGTDVRSWDGRLRQLKFRGYLGVHTSLLA